MKKKFGIKILLLTISVIIISSYFIINLMLGSNELRQSIKKYIFPYKHISQQQYSVSLQKRELDYLNQEKLQREQFVQPYLLELELEKRKTLSDILINESVVKLSNDLILKKYQLSSGFYFGISNLIPGSGYIDFHENNIFILSSRGFLAFRKHLSDDNENFKLIKNNIDNFIGMKQFNKSEKFSIKDILIFNDKIFISYSDEIEEDCWNTSVIYGNINYQNILFKKLFSPEECIHSTKNVEKEFEAHSSGGRLVAFDDNNILFSIGDWRQRYLAQDEKSVNGKIIKINIDNSDYEIVSMGHRNPQGLYFDKENNIILETEHGPQGGDEINLIEVNKISKDNIQNFGWAISSAGEHYGGRIEKNNDKYTKYPLYNSHSEHGFIEPIKSFVPSIGISEIVKIKKNKYVTSSMGKARDGDKSLYFFEINSEQKIINLEQVKVFERVRDLRFYNNELYLFMEDSASIGVIDLNILGSIKNN